MTAAPEPTTYLALVVFHPSLDMVVTPRRDGPITFCHVTCGPAHHLAHSGLHRTAGIPTLCTKKEEKASVQLSILIANAIHEMHNVDHDADRQYEGPPIFSNSGTLILRLLPQAQETKGRPSFPFDRNDIDLGQQPSINKRHLRFRCSSPDA